MQLDIFATPFEQAQADYEEACEDAAKAIKKKCDAQSLRDELCPHTKIEGKSSYYPGSYNDTAYTNYWNECSCCGAKSEVISERHGYYG